MELQEEDHPIVSQPQQEKEIKPTPVAVDDRNLTHPIEGTVLNPILPHISPVHSLIFSASNPGPSKPKNYVIPLSKFANEQLDSIITSIPDLDLNRRPGKGEEAKNKYETKQ